MAGTFAFVLAVTVGCADTSSTSSRTHSVTGTSPSASSEVRPCDAAERTEQAFVLGRGERHPFDVRIPELPGWQRNRGADEHGDGIGLQRRDTLTDDFRSPTAMMTVHVGDPVHSVEDAVAANRRRAESSARDWRTRDDLRITTCGVQGGKITGVFDGGQWWEDRRVLVHVVGNVAYPIFLSAKTRLADMDRLGDDFTTMFDGVRALD
ncbi:hypothetical protein ACWEKT_08525 [Nocardia takedensis]